MLGGFTRSLSALVHFTLHTGAGVDSVVYIVHVEYMDYVYGASCVLTVFIPGSHSGSIVTSSIVTSSIGNGVFFIVSEVLCYCHSVSSSVSYM